MNTTTPKTHNMFAVLTNAAMTKGLAWEGAPAILAGMAGELDRLHNEEVRNAESLRGDLEAHVAALSRKGSIGARPGGGVSPLRSSLVADMLANAQRHAALRETYCQLFQAVVGMSLEDAVSAMPSA